MDIRKGCALVVGLLGAAGVSLLLAPPAAGGEGAIALDRNGDVDLEAPLRIGDTLLQPGRYAFRDEEAGGDHFVVAERRELRRVGRAGGYALHSVGEAARVRCQANTAAPRSPREIVTRPGQNGVLMAAVIYVNAHKRRVFALLPGRVIALVPETSAGR